jgi:hypothetical protein
MKSKISMEKAVFDTEFVQIERLTLHISPNDTGIVAQIAELLWQVKLDWEATNPPPSPPPSPAAS